MFEAIDYVALWAGRVLVVFLIFAMALTFIGSLVCHQTGGECYMEMVDGKCQIAYCWDGWGLSCIWDDYNGCD